MCTYRLNVSVDVLAIFVTNVNRGERLHVNDEDSFLCDPAFMCCWHVSDGVNDNERGLSRCV